MSYIPRRPASNKSLGARALSTLIGKLADWSPAAGISFRVEVRDSRTAWDRVDVLIVPVDGNGAKWVSLSSVKELPPDTISESVGSYVRERAVAGKAAYLD